MQIKSQVLNNQFSEVEQIKDAKYQIQQVHQLFKEYNYTCAISNNLMYIISGGSDRLLKIWSYKTNHLIKSIRCDCNIFSCKFTEDSQLLYVGIQKIVYQFCVNNQFKKLCKQTIHGSIINNIQCITNSIILTSSWDLTIIKTNFNQRQQLLKINAHNSSINGFDYNKSLNIIVSGSDDKSIKLWSGNDGSLIIEKLNAYKNKHILQVLFLVNNEQLISLVLDNNLIIWKLNFKTKQLEKVKLICNFGSNISLILKQQFIITTGEKFVKIYTIEGEQVRSFKHQVVNIWQLNITQHESMKAVLILGQSLNFQIKY